MRPKHYSYRTEQAYAGCVKRRSCFNGLGHPFQMADPEIEACLSVPPNGPVQPLARSEAERESAACRVRPPVIP